MATKLKRFSRSKAVKTLLVILFLGCFAAAGVIAGYLPAYGYMDGNIYIADVLLADNYYESECYADKVVSDLLTAESIVRDNVRLHEISKTYDDLKELSIYAEANWRGGLYSNYYNRDDNYVFTLNETGISSKTGNISTELARRSVGFILQDFADEREYITIGYTQAQIDEQAAWWYQTRRNMQIILISEIALIAVGIVLLCMICTISGEDKEGNATFPKFLRLPYEISLLGVICTAVLFGFILFNDTFLADICHTLNGRTLTMTISGVVLAIVAAFLLYHAVSVAVRIKNGKAYRGSIILLAVHYVLKLVKWVVRSIWTCN